MFDFYDISSYCQADEFLQFDNFQISEETKKDAIQYAKGKLIDSIGGYIEDQCSSGRSSGTICNDPNYKKKILMFYQCGFSKNDSYQTIIDNAGVVYNNIIQFNYKLGIHKDLSIYDHFLVYCMAGWIKENLLDYSVDNRSQKDIASDITTRIFEYLKYTHAA